MRLDYPIALLCRVFDVSRSGFYAWIARKPSQRQQAGEQLKVAIKAVHRQSRETYGIRRIQPELAAQGFPAGRVVLDGDDRNWACAASRNASSQL